MENADEEVEQDSRHAEVLNLHRLLGLDGKAGVAAVLKGRGPLKVLWFLTLPVLSESWHFMSECQIGLHCQSNCHGLIFDQAPLQMQPCGEKLKVQLKLQCWRPSLEVPRF